MDTDWCGPLTLPGGVPPWRSPRTGPGGAAVHAVCRYWPPGRGGPVAALVGVVRAQPGGTWAWQVLVAVRGRRGRLLWRRWRGGQVDTVPGAKASATRAARAYAASPVHLGWQDSPPLAVVA